MKIFSAVPVSMADEQTMSTITWLNAPRRSSQLPGTLQDHIKIRQWHRYKPKVTVFSNRVLNIHESSTQNTKVPFKPVVHWRDMEARATVSTHKCKASELEEESDTIVAGRTPAQPRPFDSPLAASESDLDLDLSDSETRMAGCSTPTAVPVDDGVRWLNRSQTPTGAAIHTVRDRFTIAGQSELNLAAPFFREILDETPNSSFQAPLHQEKKTTPGSTT